MQLVWQVYSTEILELMSRCQIVQHPSSGFKVLGRLIVSQIEETIIIYKSWPYLISWFFNYSRTELIELELVQSKQEKSPFPKIFLQSWPKIIN